jgi:hypothetical protein
MCERQETESKMAKEPANQTTNRNNNTEANTYVMGQRIKAKRIVLSWQYGTAKSPIMATIWTKVR